MAKFMLNTGAKMVSIVHPPPPIARSPSPSAPQAQPSAHAPLSLPQPVIGLGTWLAKPDEIRQAVETAIDLGYRLIDCARVYGNEHEIGEAIANKVKEGKVTRQDLWLTGKLWNTDHHPDRVEQGLAKSLSDLDTGYLDLYLIHWPVAFKYHGDDVLFPRNSEGDIDVDTSVPLAATWSKLVDLKRSGKVKAIGLSNVSCDMLRSIVEAAKSDDEVPSVVQTEYHPMIAPVQRPLKEYCDSKNIVVTAYSGLGNNRLGLPRVIDLAEMQELAAKTGLTEAQLATAWALTQGVASIPKSVNPGRLASNLEATKHYPLSEDQMHLIDSLPCRVAEAEEIGGRYNIPMRYPAPNGPWSVDIFGHEEEKSAKYRVMSDGSIEAR